MSAVVGNRWDTLPVLSAVDAVPTRRVSVCIPARDPGVALDRTLAGLRSQRYPSALLEVVISDDASASPIEVDATGLDLVVDRRDGRDGFGAAAARNRAAEIATGDVLVFLDADVVPSPDFVAAMARWFDQTDDAVVLGAMRFVDLDGIGADEVGRLLLDGGWDDLVRSRRIPGQDWRAGYVAESRGLTVDEVDLFRVVTGAALAVHPDRFNEVGGFCEVPIRGIEDTELGYRLMANGGILVPDATALVWHQGRPTLRGSAARRNRRERQSTTERLLPVGGFRGPAPVADRGESIAERACVRVVDDGDGTAASVIERIRRVGGTDVSVAAVPAIEPRGGFTPAFAQVWCSPRYAWGPGTLLRLIDELADPEVGRVRVPDPDGGFAVDAYTTRALCRAARHDDGTPVADRVARLFGERWVAAERLDLRPVADEAASGRVRRREVWAQRALARLRWIGRTGRRRAAAADRGSS
ncbi:MAG: glycosyltransferase [Acidimicrobiales bacterium]